MAWRDPESNLTFMAPGDERGTWASVGPTLDGVQHNCSMMVFNYSGTPRGFMPAAADFSAHEWLYAPYMTSNGTLFFLVHNEFHGWESFPELCNATSMVDGRCWYNSVSLSVSHDGGRHIRHAAPPPHHLVAASDDIYEPNHHAYGVFSPSQIVRHPRDGFLYSFPICKSKDGTTSGVCIMRTTERELVDAGAASWHFWRGGGSDSFTGRFVDPYVQKGELPAVLEFPAGVSDDPHPSQPVPRYVPHLDLFLMCGYANMPGSPPHQHFGFSTAPEPWGPWSAMAPITGVEVDPKNETPFIRGLYPSLLDPNSGSLNFDTLEGDAAYVYWVQGRNKAAVGAPDMARDVWRQKVQLSWS